MCHSLFCGPVCKCQPATPLPTHSIFSFIEFSHFEGYGVFHRGFVAFPCGHRWWRTLYVLIDRLESCLVKYLLMCFAYFSFRLSAFFSLVICRNYLHIVNIRPLLGVCVAGSLLFCGLPFLSSASFDKPMFLIYHFLSFMVSTFLTSVYLCPPEDIFCCCLLDQASLPTFNI